MAHNYRRGEIVMVALGEVELSLSTKKPPTSLYSVVKLPKGTAGLKQESYVLCH
jgi:hypothetical protein